MTDLERLILALTQQTLALNRLAESNLALSEAVASLVGGEEEEEQGPNMTTLS